MKKRRVFEGALPSLVAVGSRPAAYDGSEQSTEHSCHSACQAKQPLCCIMEAMIVTALPLQLKHFGLAPTFIYNERFGICLAEHDWRQGRILLTFPPSRTFAHPNCISVTSLASCFPPAQS